MKRLLVPLLALLAVMSVATLVIFCTWPSASTYPRQPKSRLPNVIAVAANDPELISPALRRAHRKACASATGGKKV